MQRPSMNSDDPSNPRNPLSNDGNFFPHTFRAEVTDTQASTPKYDWDYYRNEFQKITETYLSYSRKPDLELLSAAFHFSYAKHKDQRRKSGLPYFDHLIEVVKILVQQKMDAQTLAAAFLHDVIEDTGVKSEEIRALFGETVLLLVDGVTKIGGLAYNTAEQSIGENYRKMLMSLIKDIRVIIIKLADRLHNMRTIDSLPRRKQERIAIETRDVYAPLAHRFGMARIRWELEDLVLKTLDPQAYNELIRLINESRVEREKYIQAVCEPIQKKLSDYNIQAQIHGRPKHFFSIYNKMKKRQKSFQEIYDLLAIRIITNSKEDCYNALGVVHSTYKPVAERFKDYIAMPKSNGYQSIHTTVIGPDGKAVEIQIRSLEMHHIAEDGIAAHWLYKEDRHAPNQFDQQLSWIKQLIEQQIEPSEFVENLKIDLYRDEIFVFTPKGDLHQLPDGATVIDFAFSVHSELGFHCTGAKVNGRFVPITTVLNNGDQVEILTSDKQTPSRHWMQFVKTSKARDQIRKFFRQVEFQQSYELGREMLMQELKSMNIHLAFSEIEDKIDLLRKELNLESVEMLIAMVGNGLHSLKWVARKIAGWVQPKKSPKKSIFQRLIRREKPDSASIVINGMDNLMIQYANCCNPIPGDEIIGYVTHGKGISVHCKNCKNAIEALRKDPDRLINTVWRISPDATFFVPLKVTGYDRKNFLNEVTAQIGKLNTNINNAEMKTVGNENIIDLVLEVNSTRQLNKIIENIRKVEGVIDVYRTVGFLFPNELDGEDKDI